jgi:hypothetical protein
LNIVVFFIEVPGDEYPLLMNEAGLGLRFPALAIGKNRKDGARRFCGRSGTEFIADVTRIASQVAVNEMQGLIP